MFRLICFLALSSAASVYAETVIQDEEVSISREELQQIVQRWTTDMRTTAANNLDLRRELVTLALASKKIALAAEQISPEIDPAFYWEVELQLRGVLRHLMIKHYLATVELPDLEPLAAERYIADKDQYALVPERRLSSHILFKCVAGDCDFDKVNRLANETLAALNNGADFAELVAKYSDDPGSKDKGGQLGRWLAQGEPHVASQYMEAVYAIDKVGGYSELVGTQFGLHIIRLDEIEPSSYKSYEEVKGQIIQSIEGEYKRLAAMEFDQQYGPSGTLVLADEALEEIFAPYKTFDAEAEAEAEVEAVE